MTNINFKYYWRKLLAFLRVSQVVGGIEISDMAIRFAYYDGKAWHLGGVRLEPGVMDGGQIKKRDEFSKALKVLRSQVFSGRNAKKKMNVVVSLSSIGIYSQVFSLPIIEGENLNKAIELNIQMVSPMDTAQTYSGWQTVGEDKKSLRLEILSAFIDRGTVDEIGVALAEEGFISVAVESRALALTRLLRDEGEGFDPTQSYILVSLDNSGLDFLIVRQGQLYFEYFHNWRDLVDENGQVSKEAFDAAIVRNLHQVINFYSQHWPEPLRGIVVSATAMKDEAISVITSNFQVPQTELKLRTIKSIGSEWFIVLGCGLRGVKPRNQDKEMSLLGIGAEEEFRREQLVAFASFWRLLLPVSLGFLLAIFFMADLFLIQTRSSLESQSLLTSELGSNNETKALQARAENFNKSVAMIGAVQSNTLKESVLLDKILNLASASGITVSHFYFRSVSAPISLSGQASSEEQIVAFKNKLEADQGFADVNLPLTGITAGSGGLVFSMTFTLLKT